jgi:peptidylprolyl isomerase
MKKIAFLYFFAAAFASCTVFHKKGCRPSLVKDPVTLTTASGLQYKISTRGCGEQVQKGDTVKVHYTGKLTNDTVFDSSVKRNEPFSVKIGRGMVIKGWDEGIPLMHVGDKATFIIPPNLGYGDRALEKIPANSTLIFDVEVLEAKAGVRKWNTKGKDTVTTASGLKFISLSDTKQPEFAASNTAAAPVAGNKVKVHYSGYLLDGSLFDSSVERGQPIEFTLGRGQVIKGWDEGIALLHKGQKGQLIIPYKLAYGENGRPPVIPAKSVLIFDVELVDFSK